MNKQLTETSESDPPKNEALCRWNLEVEVNHLVDPAQPLLHRRLRHHHRHRHHRPTHIL